MPKTSKNKPADQPCQLFEFLLKTTNGAEAFVYTIPEEEAIRLSKLFGQLNDPSPNLRFIEFALVNGRFIHLNVNFLIGFSRLDLVGRAADQTDSQTTADAKLHGSQTLSDPEDAPALMLFIDGLAAPLICHDVDVGDLDLTARILQDESATTAIVRIVDEENLRTRFIPARNIILMDSIEYQAPGPT